MFKKALLAVILLWFPILSLAVTPYAGKWEGRYFGGDHGRCAINVQASGRLTGTCQSGIETKITFHVAGFVRGTAIHFGIAGTGATLSGYMEGNHGKGTWRNTGDGGKWSVKKDN